jgi:hypothetical protein
LAGQDFRANIVKISLPVHELDGNRVIRRNPIEAPRMHVAASLKPNLGVRIFRARVRLAWDADEHERCSPIAMAIVSWS